VLVHTITNDKVLEVLRTDPAANNNFYRAYSIGKIIKPYDIKTTVLELSI